MILYNLYKERLDEQIEQAKVESRTQGRAEGKAEGKVEGIAENYQLWSAWNNRRMEAEGKDMPFNEPPPPPPQMPASE